MSVSCSVCGVLMCSALDIELSTAWIGWAYFGRYTKGVGRIWWHPHPLRFSRSFVMGLFFFPVLNMFSSCTLVPSCLSTVANQMKQEMNRACEDHEHSMARFLQLKRNSEESVTVVSVRERGSSIVRLSRYPVVPLCACVLMRVLSARDAGGKGGCGGGQSNFKVCPVDTVSVDPRTTYHPRYMCVIRNSRP